MRSLTATCVAISMVTASLLAGRASAAHYSESVNGDLSGDRNAPTNVALGLGINTLISGSGGSAVVDRDYIHYSLPAGLALSEIRMRSYTGDDTVAFIGVQAGSTFTEPPTGANVANLLGWSHFGPGGGDQIGDNILDDIGAGPNAIGFTGSLSGSDYTFWLQQTDTASPSVYQLDFVVVPEPGSFLMLGAASFVLAVRRRSRA